MFRTNLSFIMELARANAPVDQIISAFAETFLAVEEQLDLQLKLSGGTWPTEDSAQAFGRAIEAILVGVDELDQELALKLAGNTSFLRQALRAGDPADGILYLMARTLDAVRAPIDRMQLSDAQRTRLSSATAHMLRGLHELEGVLDSV